MHMFTTSLALSDQFCTIAGYEAFNLELWAHSQYANKLSQYANSNLKKKKDEGMTPEKIMIMIVVVEFLDALLPRATLYLVRILSFTSCL